MGEKHLEGEYFKIRYDAMQDFYECINRKMAQWDTKLNQLQSKYNEFIESNDFQGKGVDSAKLYFKETHDTLVEGIKNATIEYRVKYMNYKIGYYGIDNNDNSRFPEEVFKQITDKFENASIALEEISSGIGKSLLNISDLMIIPNPGTSQLNSTIEGIRQKIRDLSNDVVDYEKNQLSPVTGDLEELIDSLGQVINGYLSSERNVTNYHSQDVYTNEAFLELKEKTKRSEAFLSKNQIYSEEMFFALEKLKEVKEEYSGYLEKQASGAYYQEYLANVDENGFCYMYGIEVSETRIEDSYGDYAMDWKYNENGIIELRDLGFDFNLDGYDVNNMSLEEYINLMGPIWELSKNHKSKQDLYKDLKTCITVLSGLSGVYSIETLLAGFVADTTLDSADVFVSAISGDKAGVITGIVCMALPQVLDFFASGGKTAVKSLDGMFEGMSEAKKIEMLQALEKEGIKDIDNIMVEQSSIKIYSKDTVYDIELSDFHFEGGSSSYGSYSTKIDTKVTVINKQELPNSLVKTFKDGNYRTVITNEDITVYRSFGHNAEAGGAFATSNPALNRIKTKVDSAILPEWKNTLKYEAEIVIPKGSTINIGRVEEQFTMSGARLAGDADQFLLPQNWDLNWIKSIREVKP